MIKVLLFTVAFCPTIALAAPCGMENCHGMDVKCGSDIAEFCTEEYQLGDGCRQFARCAIRGGKCELVPDKRFDRCRDCVYSCEGMSNEDVFRCEAKCVNL